MQLCSNACCDNTRVTQESSSLLMWMLACAGILAKSNVRVSLVEASVIEFRASLLGKGRG